jgi:hypothetical protein
VGVVPIPWSLYRIIIATCPAVVPDGKAIDKAPSPVLPDAVVVPAAVDVIKLIEGTPPA